MTLISVIYFFTESFKENDTSPYTMHQSISPCWSALSKNKDTYQTFIIILWEPFKTYVMAPMHWMYVLVVDVDVFLDSSFSRKSISSRKRQLLQLITRWLIAMIDRLRTARRGLASCGSSASCIDG